MNLSPRKGGRSGPSTPSGVFTPNELSSHPSLPPCAGHTLSKQGVVPETHGGRTAAPLQGNTRQAVSRAPRCSLPPGAVPARARTELRAQHRAFPQLGVHVPPLPRGPEAGDKAWDRHLRHNSASHSVTSCPQQPLLSLPSLQSWHP